MPVSHGLTQTREYGIWCGMISRCENIHDTSYSRYGSRGIAVCTRWREDFAAFYLDMGESPSGEHSIERCDNAGNYEPGNCKWATRAEQARNRRNVLLIDWRGEKLCAKDWALRFGIKPATLRARLRAGMSIEAATSIAVGDNALRTRGESHGRSKLTAKAVYAIRSRPHDRADDLAMEFGVSVSLIRQVLRGDVWRQINAAAAVDKATQS